MVEPSCYCGAHGDILGCVECMDALARAGHFDQRDQALTKRRGHMPFRVRVATEEQERGYEAAFENRLKKAKGES